MILGDSHEKNLKLPNGKKKHIVIYVKTNAGKSSLINNLAGQDVFLDIGLKMTTICFKNQINAENAYLYCDERYLYQKLFINRRRF